MENNKEKTLERYKMLLKLSQITSGAYDYKTIEKKAIGKIKKLLNCEHVVIFRVDKEKKELFYKSHEENQKNQVNEIRCSIDEKTFAGECAHYQAVLHVKDVQSDIRFARLPKSFRKKNPKNMLLAPMVSKGELLGVIQVINSLSDDFNSEDYEFAKAVSSQLTVSLENSMLFEKLHGQFLQVIQSMADAIGKKDAYTGGHTKRVAIFADMIGREMDLSFNDLQELQMSSVLHDIGKIGIEDKILKKDSPLTDEEFTIMKEHPRLGFEILGHIEGLEKVIEGMRYHHERPDGTGYYKLKDDEIPLFASIISVADTFDAMISNRPYRKGLSPMIAYEEIRKFSGSQFAPEVVDAFSRAFEKTGMYRPSRVAKKKKAS